MKVFIVVLLVSCSALAKNSKACDEQHAKKTEFKLLKDKMDHDPHADIGAIMARMEIVIAEHNALDSKCKR